MLCVNCGHVLCSGYFWWVAIADERRQFVYRHLQLHCIIHLFPITYEFLSLLKHTTLILFWFYVYKTRFYFVRTLLSGIRIVSEQMHRFASCLYFWAFKSRHTAVHKDYTPQSGTICIFPAQGSDDVAKNAKVLSVFCFESKKVGTMLLVVSENREQSRRC